VILKYISNLFESLLLRTLPTLAVNYILFPLSYTSDSKY